MAVEVGERMSMNIFSSERLFLEKSRIAIGFQLRHSAVVTLLQALAYRYDSFKIILK
jgi:hypothetical protein